jgi:hypothetical protein
MKHWMCTTCGYYLQGPLPPDLCPSCRQVCAFNDVTCRRTECGGEQSIDPLLVGNTLKTLKGAPEPGLTPKTPHLSTDALFLGEILRGLSEEQRHQLKSLGDRLSYEPDNVIFNEGTEARNFYLVEEGRVAIESRFAQGMRFPISIVAVGQAFGWSALVAPYIYTATAVALSRARVIAIEQATLLARMRSDPSFGLTFMENAAGIISSRLRTLELALMGLLQR